MDKLIGSNGLYGGGAGFDDLGTMVPGSKNWHSTEAHSEVSDKDVVGLAGIAIRCARDPQAATGLLSESGSFIKDPAVMKVLAGLPDLIDPVSEMFPDSGLTRQLMRLTTARHISSMVMALIAIRNDNVGFNGEIELLGGKVVGMNAFSVESALDTIAATAMTLDRMAYDYADQIAPCERVNATGRYGQYRLGGEGSLLTTVRLASHCGYNPEVEYGSGGWVHPTIAHAAEEAGGYISEVKSQQRSPLCIRADYELNGAATDIATDFGSILDPNLQALGKRIADLIAIGDDAVIRRSSRGLDRWLNHNKWGLPAFESQGGTDRDNTIVFDHEEVTTLFAWEASEVAVALEYRSGRSSISPTEAELYRLRPLFQHLEVMLEVDEP